MKWSHFIFKSALAVFLFGAIFVAIAQLYLDDVTTKQTVAIIGLVLLYLATVAFGLLGIRAHRAARLAAHKREQAFFG